LRNLRLVKPRREGRMVFYALDDRHIISLFRQGLRHVQETTGQKAHRRAR
jgi:DNA-binding transcriptional ArsR family regulator